MNPDAAGDALTGALAAALAALAVGDIAAAAAEMERIEAAVAAAQSGTPLSPTQLELARSLHARCSAVADQTQAGVVAELLQSAVQRKAAGAYGSTS